MKRWLTHGFIGTYLAILMYGVVCHTINYKPHEHLGMYFIVWDMYCGWDAYETRRHLVAEGLSGNYYELSPAPWGNFIPFGSAARHDYDGQAQYSGRIATNVLKHTDHEPITRVFLIDESWPRKYNLPEHLWKQRYDEPQDKYSYNYLRAEYTPEGECAQLHYPWKTHLTSRALMANPRLMEEVARTQPFMATSSRPAGQSMVTPVSYLQPSPDPIRTANR